MVAGPEVAGRVCAYAVLGETVLADRDLCGLSLGHAANVGPVLRLKRRSIPVHTAVTWLQGPEFPLLGRSDESTWFDFGDGLVFEHDPRCSTIWYSADSEIDDRTFTHAVVDAVLPRVLTLLGHRVLHGGSVAGSRGAAILLGSSGAGKSTLTAAVARAGGSLLGDDAAVLTRLDDAIAVVPSGTPMRLFEHSATAALGSAQLGEAMAYWSAKRVVDPAFNGLAVGTLPVAVAAFVELAVGETMSLERISRADTFRLLLQHAFDVPTFSDADGLAALDRWSGIAHEVPAYRLTRPLNLDRLGESCDAVLSIIH